MMTGAISLRSLTLTVRRPFLSGVPAMRKVTFGGANSLDNFFARPDGSYDWLLWCDEAAAFMKEYWKTIDAMVMGRKTYEVAVRNSQGQGLVPHKGVKTYLRSRTMTGPSRAGVESISKDGVAL